MPQTPTLTSAPHFQVLAQEPKAVLLIVHGLAEYAERYRGIAERLARQRISTIAYDQRGHGRADGVRTHVDRFDHFVHDVSAVYRNVVAQFPGVPVFVWGHSMGSIASILFAANEPALSGLIASSNSLEVFKRGTNPLNPFIRFAALVAPWVRISLGLDARKISRDADVQRAYATDPLIPHTASLRLIVEFAKACEQARDLAENIAVPALVIHGRNDRIAPARGSEIFWERLRSRDKTLKIFPEGMHEVHNDIEGDRRAFQDLIAQWILERTEGR